MKSLQLQLFCSSILPSTLEKSADKCILLPNLLKRLLLTPCTWSKNIERQHKLRVVMQKVWKTSLLASVLLSDIYPASFYYANESHINVHTAETAKVYTEPIPWAEFWSVSNSVAIALWSLAPCRSGSSHNQFIQHSSTFAATTEKLHLFFSRKINMKIIVLVLVSKWIGTRQKETNAFIFLSEPCSAEVRGFWTLRQSSLAAFVNLITFYWDWYSQNHLWLTVLEMMSFVINGTDTRSSNGFRSDLFSFQF